MKFFLLISLFINIILLSQISCVSRALYFDKEKCLQDNLYSGMNLLITYKITDTDIKLTSTNKSLFRITIRAETKDVFKLFYGTKLTGKFSYNVEESDKYRICITSSDRDIFKLKKFLHLVFKIQSSDEIYDENSAKAKDFQKVNITMQNLNSKVDSIEVMQNFQVDVEDQFSKKQIETSSRLAFLSIVQIIIICLVGVYHVYSLRKVFKDKIWTPF